MQFPSQCLVLVGGRGTRLGALTDALPKPMVPVAGKPFLDHVLGFLGRFAFREIVLLAGYCSRPIVERYGSRHRVVVEREPRGTGGALLEMGDSLAPSFIMLNGDSLFDIDLRALAEGDPGLGRLALRRAPDTSRSGAVRLDGERIVEFKEKAGGGAGLINGGIYLLRRAIVERIGAVPCSIEREVFPRLAAEGLLSGKVFDGYFIDIGVPADLERARHELGDRA